MIWLLGSIVNKELGSNP